MARPGGKAGYPTNHGRRLVTSWVVCQGRSGVAVATATLDRAIRMCDNEAWLVRWPGRRSATVIPSPTITYYIEGGRYA